MQTVHLQWDVLDDTNFVNIYTCICFRAATVVHRLLTRQQWEELGSNTYHNKMMLKSLLNILLWSHNNAAHFKWGYIIAIWNFVSLQLSDFSLQIFPGKMGLFFDYRYKVLPILNVVCSIRYHKLVRLVQRHI